MLAARDCFFNGATIEDIAKQAKKSKATIQEWIKTVCAVHSWESVIWLKDRFQAECAEAERTQPSFNF